MLNVFAFGVFINLVFCCEMSQFDLFRPETVIKFNHFKKFKRINHFRSANLSRGHMYTLLFVRGHKPKKVGKIADLIQ